MSILGMALVILALNVIGWGVLLGVVVPQEFSLGASGVLGVGIGVTAFTLGMRHAFDADHIAAIDNTTRKLMAEGDKPVSVGFWFSLGHSSVVFGLFLLLTFGIKALANQVTDDGSGLQATLGTVGTLVSGVFLILIGLINLVVLVQIVKLFGRMRAGELNEAELDAQLENRGFMYRFLGRATKLVTKPWQMYPIGFLFGLGFDTATQVSLLVLAGGAAAFALPWYALLCLPILFAAGMSLLDTIDGCFMNFAYGWALSNPFRKMYYNITVTSLSVFVALVIGAIELISLLSQKLGIEDGPLGWVASIDLDRVGFVIVGLFVLTFALSGAVYKFGRVEQRWSSSV